MEDHREDDEDIRRNCLNEDEPSEVSSLHSSSTRTSMEHVSQRLIRQPHSYEAASGEYDAKDVSEIVDVKEVNECDGNCNDDVDNVPKWTVHATASLFNEAGSLLSATGDSAEYSRVKAIGKYGICVLSIGTFFILGTFAFLTYFWCTSMRARNGEVIYGSLWSLIVFSDWASRAVTLAAAVLRICLALQMGIFTAMMASLMIEKTGVPVSLAPLISMLRATSSSPYNLITWSTFDMPWGIGSVYTIVITISVLLTVASQFASTALLSDFSVVNVTAPRVYADVFYGNSSVANPTVIQGSTVWTSKPSTYFRFAEQPRSVFSQNRSDIYEDTGSILRAFPPFTSESSRTRLLEYHGPAPVVNSRVVCVQPTLRNVTFSVMAFEETIEDTTKSVDTYSEFKVHGNFSIEGDFTSHPITPPEIRDKDQVFNCVVPADDIFGYAVGEPLASQIDNFSLCKVVYNATERNAPSLPSSFGDSPTSVFLILNGTGQTHAWQTYLKGPLKDNRLEASGDNWKRSAEGIWSRIERLDNRPLAEVGVAISACFVNLEGRVKNISMHSSTNGREPALEWDSFNSHYSTNSIRRQYWGSPNDRLTAESRGLLTLDSVSRHDPGGEDFNVTFDDFASRLPTMASGTKDPLTNPLPCAMLRTGGYSSRAVHYAHSSLFQDVLRTSGSVPEALQAMLTVAQQMAYYETFPYFRNTWPATYTVTEERPIPVRWVGFSIVSVIIWTHLILVVLLTFLFVGFTTASRLGNVWMSLSQVVSVETEGIIQESTCKDDKEVEDMIWQAITRDDYGLRHRVKVQRNGINGRDELTSL